MQNDKTLQEESSLEEALSPLVNRLIDKNYESSKEKISIQIAPLIGNAIRKQIKSQRDDIVDALYPVVGSMISRYVSKMFEDMLTNINNQLQSGLSFKKLKRKVISKIKGVSESELLFSENATANIGALLLIHKETGIVLAHVENPDYPVSEPEMLASMMTAIRSFVNDWVEKNSDNQELGEIEYGDKKIIIESSGYSYLAVIVQGSANKLVYDKIRETLENIVLNHGEEIKEFNGDLDKFGNMTIYKEISQLLGCKQNGEGQNKSLYPSALFFSFFIILGIFFYYTHHRDELLQEKIDNIFYKTPALTLFKLDAQVNSATVILKGEVPFAYHKKLAQNIVEKFPEIKELKNEIVVIEALQDPMQVSANIAYLLEGLNTKEGINLTYSFDYNTLVLKGNVWDSSLKNMVLEKFKNFKNIEKIEDQIQIVPPQIQTSICFDKDSTQINLDAQTKLITLLTTIKNVDNSHEILLSSYSDQIGSIERNRVLSNKRITKIEKFLTHQGGIKNSFISVIFDTPPQGIDAKTEPQKARCVVISYSKKGDNNVSL